MEESLELPTFDADVPKRRLLRWEKELLGIYVSDHPLTPHLDALARVVTHFSAELSDAEHGQEVCVAGEVSHIRPYRTRNGREMGFVTLEDIQGTIELVVFSRLWKSVVDWLEVDSIVVAKGKIDRERGEPKVLVDEITHDLEAMEPVKSQARRRPQARPVEPGDPQEVPPLPDPATPPEEAPLPAMPDSAILMEAEMPAEPHADPRPPGPLPPEPPPVAAPEDPGFFPPVSEGVFLEEATERREPDARMITITLESTGDRQKDALRMKRVHGLLTSYPGKDHFAFLLFEASRRYHLEFPNSTTGYCPELHGQLVEMLGEGGIRVEPLRVQ